MKQIFLDFDGVMHVPGNYHNKFEHMDAFCNSLRPFLGQFDIVISSSWKDAFSLKEIKSFFPDDIAHYIIGVTPKGLTRYDEILASLQGKTNWIALDDEAHNFPKDCKELLLVDASTGLTNGDLEKLTQFLANTPKKTIFNL